MSTGNIVGIVVVILIVAALAAWLAAEGRRRKLRQRFGSEYDRLAQERGSRRDAETELAQRQRHVAELGIRPLAPAERTRYRTQWTAVQEEFVERPQQALSAAKGIVTSAMRDRGYPTGDYDQMLADLSVDHARTLGQFRTAHEISVRAAEGAASTEDLRQAMIGYRTVFDGVVGAPADGVGRHRASGPDGETADDRGTLGGEQPEGNAEGATGHNAPPATVRGTPGTTALDQPGATTHGTPGATPRDEPLQRAEPEGSRRG